MDSVYKHIPMHIAAMLAWLLAILGFTALFSTILAKNWSKSYLTPPLAKEAMSSIRLITAIIGVFISNYRIDDKYMYYSVMASAAGYFSWEITGLINEERSKVDASRIKVLERNLGRFQSLMTTLAEFVASKRATIAQAVKAANENASGKNRGRNRVETVRQTMNPEGHITDLLRRLTSILVYDSQSASKSGHQGFRVCLYVEEAGYMTEKASFDSSKQSAAATKSFNAPELRHKFKLDNRDDPSVIVRSIQRNEMIICSDCIKENICFNEDQKKRLKSMVSYPFVIGHEPKKPLRSALVVDTNVAGHFVDEDHSFLKRCLLEYSSRIDLEIMYGELLKAESVKTQQVAGNQGLTS